MNDIIDALQNNDDNKKDNYGMLLKENKSKKGKKSHPKKDKGTYKKKTLIQKLKIIPMIFFKPRNIKLKRMKI